MENFPELPKLVIPDSFLIPAPLLDYPGVELLQFDPIFVPQTVQPGSIQDLRAPQEEEDSSEQEQNQENPESPGKEQDKGQKPQQTQQNQLLPQIQTTPVEVPSIDQYDDDSIPEEIEGVTSVDVLGLPIPMPKPEILVAAGATATVSVAATLASTSILKQLISVMKPLIKKIMTLILKKVGKTPPKSWARERLEQRQRKSPRKVT
tara:strand:- start:2125 stop:2742 length:618 start_codon:yes stop_codon:yes gene_type:complete